MNRRRRGDTKTRLRSPNAVPLIYRRSGPGLAWPRRRRLTEKHEMLKNGVFLPLRAVRNAAAATVRPSVDALHKSRRRSGAAVSVPASWPPPPPPPLISPLLNFYLNPPVSHREFFQRKLPPVRKSGIWEEKIGKNADSQ